MPGRAVAQPPGGVSSFDFQGSSRWMPANEPVQRSQLGQGSAQPPGGVSSFAFDDYGGQVDEFVGRAKPRNYHRKQLSAAQSDNLRSNVAEFCDASKENHLAGNLREYRQPPGGHPSFTLCDASAPAPLPQHNKQPPSARSSLSLEQQPDNDSLSEFVAQQTQQHGRPSVRGVEPPGGYSSFSVGWGSDDHCNHHHHYRNRPPPQDLRGQLPQSEALVPPVSYSAQGGRAQQQQQQHRAGGWYADVGAAPEPRRSTRVAQPPGGASSISFG